MAEKLTHYQCFLLVFILVMVSGNPVLYNEVAVKYVVPLIVFYLLYFLDAKFKCNFNIYLILSIVFSLSFLSHYITWSVFPLSFFSILLKLLLGYLVFEALGSRFIYYYLLVITFISSISLIMFGVQLAIGAESMPSIFNTFFWGETQRSSFFYTALTHDAVRNAGPFWEPGAFQGFLNVAFFLVPFKFFIESKRNFLVFLILFSALISTFSTTGYLVFCFIAAYKLHSLSKNVVLVAIAYASFVPLFLVVFFSLDFLSGKISDQIYYAYNSGVFDPGRFSVLEFDLHYIFKSPLFGNGYLEETRWADHPDLWGVNLGHGNGFTGYIAEMGLVSLFVYLYFVYSAFCKQSVGFGVSSVILMVLLLQGQHFMDLPFFLGLPFIKMLRYE